MHYDYDALWCDLTRHWPNYSTSLWGSWRRIVGGNLGELVEEFIEWLGMYRPPAPSNSGNKKNHGCPYQKSDTPGGDYCDWIYPNQRSWKRLQQNEQNDLRFGFWPDWNFFIVASDLIHDAILEHSPEMCGFSARNSLHASYLTHESDTLLKKG